MYKGEKESSPVLGELPEGVRGRLVLIYAVKIPQPRPLSLDPLASLRSAAPLRTGELFEWRNYFILRYSVPLHGREKDLFLIVFIV